MFLFILPIVLLATRTTDAGGFGGTQHIPSELVTLSSHGGTKAVNGFNGAWQLDITREAGSSDEMLQLIGVGSIQRSIIRSLNVVERYEVTTTIFRLKRDTIYTHSDDAFHFNIDEVIDDVILGHGTQRITSAQGRIALTITRPDGSIFTSVRKLQGGQQITNTMNFTTGQRHASCVRYYNKLQSMKSISSIRQLLNRPVRQMQ